MRLRVSLLALVVGVACTGGASSAPPAGLLVFEAADGIHFVNSDGTGLRRLPHTRPGDQNPQWSPDARRLVFWNGTLHNDEGDGRIFLSNADGSARRSLTVGEFPSWSPDGRLIAFDKVGDDGDWQVYVMNADGTDVRRVATGPYAGWWPSWTPDGSLTFTAGWRQGLSPGAVYPRRGVMLVRLDGTGLRRLPTPTADDGGTDWSLDRNALAFTSPVGGKDEIEVLTAGGRHRARVTRNRSEDNTPLWSPDGKELSFTTERNGLPEVYVMNADGTHQRRVTRFPTTYACCGDWQPR